MSKKGKAELDRVDCEGGDLPPAHVELADKFLAEVWADVEASPNGLPRLFQGLPLDMRRVAAYKFLIARKFEYAETEAMFRSTMRWRHEKGIDAVPYFPPSFPLHGYDVEKVAAFFGEPDRFGAPRPRTEVDRIGDVLGGCYQAVYHKWDKQGHPLFIENTGKTIAKAFVSRCRGLAKHGERPAQPCVDYHVHFNEVGLRLARYNNETMASEQRQGRRVTGVTAILDASGLSFEQLHRPFLDTIRQAWALDKDYYPEGLHALYVANAPAAVSMAWNIVKGWLDPSVHKKVNILTPEETKQRLLEVIDADCLPAELGGTCPPVFTDMDADAASPTMEGSNDQPLSESVEIKNKAKLVRELEVAASDTIVWEFESEDTKSVLFSLVFTPAGGAPTTVWEEAKQRIMSEKFVAPGPGKVQLVFSNEHSMLRNKTLTLRLWKLCGLGDSAPPTPSE